MKIYQLMQTNKITELVEYIKNKDICGVSLLTIIDLLIPMHFSVEELRERGAIVTFEQLFTDSDAYLADIENTSVDTQDQLKRLQFGIMELINSWKQGRLQNQSLEELLTQEALHRIESAQSESTLASNARKHLDQQILEKFKTIYKAWAHQDIESADNGAMDEVVNNNLLVLWRNPTNINSQLILQLKQYMVDILLTRYQQGILSKAIVEHVERHVIAMILNCIRDKTIGKHKALSEALSQEVKHIIGNELVVDLTSKYKISISKLLVKWLNNRLTEAEGHSVESFVRTSLTTIELQSPERDEVEHTMIEVLITEFKAQNLVKSLQIELDANLSNLIINYLYGRYRNDSQFFIKYKKDSAEQISSTLNFANTAIDFCPLSSSVVEFKEEGKRKKLFGENLVKQKLVKRVSSEFQLGKAIGQGDCFFDALAQGLNNLTGRREFSVKSLRLLCDEYVKNSMNANWVKTAVINNGGIYEQYLIRLQFTADEVDTMKHENNIDLDQAEWGNPHIEGRIICGILKAKHNLVIKLHVMEVLEHAIEGVEVFEQLIDANIVKSINNLSTEDYQAANTIHLVNYKNHFVPLIVSKPTQPKLSLTQLDETPLKNEIIQIMLNDWKRNELPSDVSKALDKLLLQELNEVIQSINQMISIPKNAAELKRLERQVQGLSQEVKKLPTLEQEVRELKQLVNGLMQLNTNLKKENTYLKTEVELLEVYKTQSESKQFKIPPSTLKTFFLPTPKLDKDDHNNKTPKDFQNLNNNK